MYHFWFSPQNSDLPYMKFKGTYSDTFYGITGWITSDGTECYICIPLIFNSNINSIKVTKIVASVRHAQGGYVGGENNSDLTSYIRSCSIFKTQGIISISLVNPNKWNITNNTPVSGLCEVTYVLS